MCEHIWPMGTFRSHRIAWIAGFAPIFSIFLIALPIAYAEPDEKKSATTNGKAIARDDAKSAAGDVRYAINGFQVHFNNSWFDPQNAQCQKVLREMRENIDVSVMVLPADALKKLRRVPVYVEWDESDLGMKRFSAHGYLAACYVPRESTHAYRGTRCGCIVVCAANCLSGKRAEFARKQKPFWFLHELAHAYHDRMSVFESDFVTSTFRAAVARKLYEGRPSQSGNKPARWNLQTYARQDDHEYFAELTETYLGRQTAYPFTASDLREYDPQGYVMMLITWGDTKVQAKRLGELAARQILTTP